MVSTRRTAKANNEEPQQLEYFGHGIAAAKYSFNSLSATYKILADSEDGPVRPLKRKRDEEEPAEGQTSKRNKTESDRDGVTEVDTTVKPVRPVKMQSNIDYSKKTVAQLKVLLRKKGMAAGPKDRKNNLIAKLEARDGGESASQTQTVQTEQKSGHGIDHSKKTVAVLRKLLQLRYLSTVGKKAELVARLEANSALYEQGKIKLPVTPQNQITRPCEQWSSSQPPLDSDMSGDDNVVRRSGSLERGLGNNYSPPLFPQHSSPETPSRLPNPARVSSKEQYSRSTRGLNRWKRNYGAPRTLLLDNKLEYAKLFHNTILLCGPGEKKQQEEEMSRPSISPDPYVSAGARISHKLSRIAETWMNIRRKSSQTLLLNLEHLDADQLNHIQSVIDAFITPPISLPKAFSYAGSSTDTSSEESSQAALSTGTSSEESSQAALSTGTSFGWSDWGHTRRSDENTDKGDDHPDDGKKAPSLDFLELQLLGADVSDDDNSVQASDNQKAKGDDSRSSPASSPRSQPDVDLPDISKLISPTAPTNRQENFSGSFVGSLFSEPINFSSSPPVSIQKSQAADDLQVQATEQNKPVNDSLFNVSRYDSSSPAVDKLQADNDLQEETLAQDDSGMDSLFDMTVDFSSSLPIQDSEADDDLIEPVAMQHDSTVRNKIGERMQTLDQDIEVASVLVTDQNVKKNGSSDAQADALTSVNLNMSQDSILHVLQPVTDQTQESQATEKRIQQITEEGDALEEVMESEFHFETSRSADLPVSEPNASREERNLQPEQIIDLLFRDDEDEIVTAQESISDEDEVSNSNKNEASSKARDLGVSQPDISWVSVNSGPSQLIRADLPSTQIRPSATVPRYLEHMPLVKTEEAAQRILADRTQHVQDNVCSRFQQGSIIPPRAILATAVQLANYISQIEYEKTLSQVQSFSESKIPEKEQPRQTPNDLFKESVRDKHPDHSVEIPKESIHGKQTTTHDSQKQHQPLTPAPTSLFPRNPNPCPITPDFAPPNDALLTSYINNDTPASSTQITEEEFHRFQRRGCSRVPRAPGYDPVADLHPSSRLYNPASDNHEEYDPSEPARGLEQTRHLSGQSEETYDPNDPGKGLPFGHVIRK